jgi:4-amino-4-deoxy-L-arabinose transferase-like glycosyltransferase
MTGRTAGTLRLWLASAPVLIIFLFSAYWFARAQNIWVDETTQLSGITLGPRQLIAWLSGNYHPPFGVPADRMPPVSYFIDMLGWRLWGDNELAFRLYHAAITAGGIVILMAALARRYSLRAALIAGLLLALSPRLVATAVEIRAYPILLALSCAQVSLLIRGDVANNARRLTLFLILGLLSGYTHFFGLIATSAYTAAVFIDSRDWKSAARVVAGYILLLALWAGLAPFVSGASSISDADAVNGTSLSDIVAFLAQILISNATMVDPIVAGVCIAGAALLILLGTVGLGLKATSVGLAIRHEPAIGLAIALASGIAVTVLAGLLVAHFNALAPRYSIWMLPPLIVLLALAADGVASAPGRVASLARSVGGGFLLVGSLAAASLFLMRADWYVHGPSRTLETMVDRATKPVAILHIGDTWAWGYFPLYRTHRDALPQWLLTADGQSAIRITRGGDASGQPVPLSTLSNQMTLVASHVELKSYDDLRKILKDGEAPATADLAPALNYSGWQREDTVYRPGNFTFTGTVYRRSTTGCPPTTLASAARF